MFRIIWFYILIIGAVHDCFSQVNNTYNVVYTLDYKLNVEEDAYTRENFDLVGNGSISVFKSQGKFKRDSLLSSSSTQFPLGDNNLPKFNQAYSIIKLKDSLIYEEPMPVDNFRYRESLLSDWKLPKNKTKVIEGFNCMLATVEYGGRKWKAWYTLEIPIQDGPYKFSGLPGLILEISDSQEHYIFKFHSFTLNSAKNLRFRTKLSEATSIAYNDFLKLRVNSSASWNGFLNATGVEVRGIDPVSVRKSDKNRQKRLNFIELK